MKYYKINQIIIDFERKSNGLSSDLPSANGQFVPNYSDFFTRIGNGEIVEDAPIFDYFHLQSFGPKEEWEWRLQDVHGGMGEYPRGAYWYISDDFKTLLENFKIAPKNHFYETRLLYKREKYKYWIFQFPINPLQNFNFVKSYFYYIENDINKEIQISSKDDFLAKRRKLAIDFDLTLNCSKIHIIQEYDFVYNLPCSDYLVSERLKIAIETMKLEGFIFSDIDYEVTVIDPRSSTCSAGQVEV